ncbi:hypothetical protein OIU77_009538 [Salix suchowensis]|uniref:Photosystem II subunit Q-2 n=1 Tax=Salix suchowensis TaxID=1278906 RepID=A0ABQ9AFG5_9ROSI|nr:hypothetical protein OIU77_009538 [Salix suchowensis]
MAQAMASMAGLRGASQAVLEGNLQLSGSNRLLNVPSNTARVALARPGLTVKAQQQVSAVLAASLPIKIGPPPAPSGGLPGTLNSDEARDLVLPLKERFFLQPLPPAAAAARAKESAKDIIGVKGLIDKKAWPFVQNDLRLKASYLRYDLNTVISAKSKDEKKSLKELTGKLFDTISNLDHAAKIKSSPEAEKYYAQTVSALNDVLAQLG